MDLLKRREEIEREILLTFSTLNQDHVTEDHVDGRHVTESITAEDHSDRLTLLQRSNSLKIWGPQGHLIDKIMG